MRAPTIHLVRHGHHAEVGRVLSGRSGIALDERGRAEAAALAERLTGPIDAVHASPRRRATETAAFVADRAGLPVIVTDALDEIDFGRWTGVSFDVLAPDPEWQRWNAARADAGVPGGETMRAAIDRALAFLDTLDEGVTLCVTHCDIIRGVAAEIGGIGLSRLLEFECPTGSVTTLRREAGGLRLAEPLAHAA